MKFSYKLLFLVPVIAIALNLKAQTEEVSREYGYIIKLEQQAPDFSATTIEGETIQLSELKGKVVMLQFTASWCGVCRKEMPHIENEIWQKYKDHPNFALLGIDLDEPAEKVKAFVEDIPVSYPMALDPGGNIFNQYAEQGAGVTRNVIIDKTGKIVFLTRLYKEKEFEEMKTVIDNLLQPTSIENRDKTLR